VLRPVALVYRPSTTSLVLLDGSSVPRLVTFDAEGRKIASCFRSLRASRAGPPAGHIATSQVVTVDDRLYVFRTTRAIAFPGPPPAPFPPVERVELDWKTGADLGTSILSF
jgi:hypothetical protein